MALPYGIIAHERMTKRFLMSLPEGVFIESGVSGFDESGPCPGLAETVAPLSEREDLWLRIKQKELDGRMFAVFASRDDYALYLRERWGCDPPWA